VTEGSTSRSAVFKGGAYLLGRQLISIGLKIVGVIMITRALEPADYGAYLSALSVYNYATVLGHAGVGVYLLRRHGEVPEATYGTAYSVLLGMAVVLVVLVLGSTSRLAAWISVPGFDKVLGVIIFSLPFQLLSVPAMARLERRLDYRRVAALEIAGQLIYYALALPLVGYGFGPVSLGAASLVQQVAVCIFVHAWIRRYPHFRFDAEAAQAMAHYATKFSFANWIWQLRMLVNPMIVGPALGAHAVGIIGLTINILETISIIKTITWRLSVAVLGKVQTDLAKLRNAVTQGMELQTLAVGSILLGFGWFGHPIIRIVFGERWLEVMDVYPYLALSYLTIAPFNMHSAVMSVINRNTDLAISFIFHMVLFAGTAWLFVPRLGMFGYGLAELATLPSYLFIDFFLRRAIGAPDYRLTTIWWTATAIGLFWSQFGLWAVAVPFLALALPLSHRKIRDYAGIVFAQ
jgi:O-antigen/teichoic acid export membrane protein